MALAGNHVKEIIAVIQPGGDGKLFCVCEDKSGPEFGYILQMEKLIEFDTEIGD